MNESEPKNLGKALRRILDRKWLSQEDAAALAGLDKSQVSRLIHKSCRNNPETLDALLMAFPDEADQYELVLAHLQDELSIGARAAIEVRPVHPTLKARKLDTHNLTLVGLDALAACLRNPHIEPLIVNIAQAIGWRDSNKRGPNTALARRGGGGGGSKTSPRKTK